MLADLARAGWPATTLAQYLDVNPRTVAEVRDKRPRLHLDLAMRIRRLHCDLINLNPASYGIHPTDIARTRTAATRRTAMKPPYPGSSNTGHVGRWPGMRVVPLRWVR
ncbi:hypothetical protein [Streptomyces collinus]|uniref:hypothetical protein n=1 Tax=Streptomyces collinus TaxID=42684 RepID=UPI0036B2AB9D